MVTDREKVIKGVECCMAIKQVKQMCEECPYRHIAKCYCCEGVLGADILALLREQSAVVAHQRDESKFMHSWRLIKYSVIETANNNAGPNGNEDVYRILTWVATMMEQQEAKWEVSKNG